MRLSAADTNPIRAAYRLEPGEGHEVMASLAALREELRERSRGGDEIDREVCTIVLTHVDKYWPQLLPTPGGGHRTTNDLESHWGIAKRGCRHTQGGRKLTRTFEALPAELMLVPNLENPHYVEIVSKTGVRTGTVNVFNVGSTGTIGAIEFEPGLEGDLPRLLDRLIPPSREYGHEQAWHDGNGHSHLQSTLLGPSLTVPISDGNLVLGSWQQIFHLDCDVKPRDRTVIVTVVGD